MGRHSAAGGVARYVGRVGAFAFALGVGAAVAGGGGVAAADDRITHDSPADPSGGQSSPGTDGAAIDSRDTVGQDPQPDGFHGVKPGGPKAALRVPRMVLGASGGARTSVVHPGGARAKPSSVGSISSLPRRVTPKSGTRVVMAHTGATPVSVDDLTRSRPTTQSANATTGLVPRIAATLSAVRTDPVLDIDHVPLAPTQSVVGVLGLISRDIEQAIKNTINQSSPPTTSQTTPDPGDVVQTPYGQVGKWMLKSDGQIANWGGQTYGDKTLLEPVNIIILDPSSTAPEEATAKLNSAMFWAGFPAQPIHSTGFKGTVLGSSYDQLPENGSEEAFSNAPFVLPNDHARVFGPAPVAGEGGGYVWTAAASTEVPGVYNGAPTHRYVSFDLARDVLALRLILGGATLIDIVPMGNVYNEGTVSTGDNDGYAIVLRLNN
jgi:hypothetical protein